MPATTIAKNPLRDAYFGDTHVHTRYSFDAYAFGTRASPDDAYRFCIELKPDFKIVIAANVPR
ncbi:MAG: DUF3604 domain-containing protein [Gammaproteobacteria bacterium]|nr:DUF3604 domain-containing protein [Gammaproteobacteria bacterium]